MKRSIGIICLLSFTASLVFAQQVDKESEIKRLRKELMQLQTERAKNKQDVTKDKKDFGDYTKRTAERLATVKNETSDINSQITVQKRRNDSLAALVNYATARTRQAEMSQNAMREKLIGSLDQLITALQGIPPMVQQNLVASASLLKNELRNKTIDNVEAFNRMQQILMRSEEVTASIQVSQEASPIAEIRGTVYRLRIGTFFEAIVNLKGEECAVWYGSEKTWKTIKDMAVAAEILKAANIREGKSLPAFVKLPLVADAENGGKQ